MQVQFGDTIAAISTSSGKAAIAMVRLSGPMALSIVNQRFAGKDLMSVPSHTLHYGLLSDAEGPVDEVVVGIYRAPHSYTGETMVEITCHGSDYLAQRVLLACTEMGARLAQAGEFTMRAFANGKLDLSQAESVADLIAARSAKAHNLALSQLRGGVRNEITLLREQLVRFASLLELELDFSEEDVEFANRDELRRLVATARNVVGKLINSFKLGNAMRHGVPTTIAGRPNAGKSTLLNALLEDDRAIVSDIAGTTRDTIEEVLQIDGIAFRLIDTAGLRSTTNEIEAIGVARALEKIGESAVLLYVFDANQMQPAVVNDDVGKLFEEAPEAHVLVVANKMDRNPYAKTSDWAGEYVKADMVVPVSALNNMNMTLLKERMSAVVHSGEIDPDHQIISHVRHRDALKKVDASLEAVEIGFAEGLTSDLIALDLRQALHWLGEITGEVTTDELLGNIFSEFCIGK